MLNVLYMYINTFRVICAVSSVAFLFGSSFILCFPCMLLRYFLNDFEMVPVTPIITGITCFYIPHALYFCCRVLVLKDLLSFFLCHIYVS